MYIIAPCYFVILIAESYNIYFNTGGIVKEWAQYKWWIEIIINCCNKYYLIKYYCH